MSSGPPYYNSVGIDYPPSLGIFLGILGIFIVVTTLLDMFISTFSINTVGLYTHTITLFYKITACFLDRWLVKLLKKSKIPFIRAFRFQRPIGVITLVNVLLFWLFSLWVGWSLIFFFRQEMIWNNVAQRTVSYWERFYLTAISMTGLGTGEIVALAPAEQACIMLATFHGVLYFALATAYVLNVVPFVSQMKTVSNMIFCVGESPYEILYRCWDSKNKTFGRLEDLLISLSERIPSITQGLRAFPIMQNFLYDPHPSSNVLLNLAVLYETLFLMSYAIDPEYQVDQLALNSVKKALHLMLRDLSMFGWDELWFRLCCLENFNIKFKEKYHTVPFHDEWIKDVSSTLLPIRKDILQVKEKLINNELFQHNRYVMKTLLEREAISWENVFYTTQNISEFLNYKMALSTQKDHQEDIGSTEVVPIVVIK